MVSCRPLWMKRVLRKRKPVGETRRLRQQGQTGTASGIHTSGLRFLWGNRVLGQGALSGRSRLRLALAGGTNSAWIKSQEDRSTEPPCWYRLTSARCPAPHPWCSSTQPSSRPPGPGEPAGFQSRISTSQKEEGLREEARRQHNPPAPPAAAGTGLCPSPTASPTWK